MLVLNHKSWCFDSELHENDRFVDVYSELWEKADRYAVNNLNEEEKAYFLDWTD